jgi:hypothetical protein
MASVMIWIYRQYYARPGQEVPRYASMFRTGVDYMSWSIVYEPLFPRLYAWVKKAITG